MRRALLLVIACVAAMMLAVAPAALAATGSPADSANLSDNPVLATNLTGWNVNGGGSALQRVAVADHVAAAFAARTVSSTSTTRIALPSEPISAAGVWTYAADVKASRAGATASVSVGWYNASGGWLSSTESTFKTVNATNWTRIAHTATPPAGAASARSQVNVIGSAKTATVDVTQHDVRSPVVAPPPTTTTVPPTTTTEPPPTSTTTEPPTSTTEPTTTTSTPPPPAGLQNRPPQSASIMWGDAGDPDNALAVAYAQPGGLISVGRHGYADQAFKDVSAAGGTVLIYMDPVLVDAQGSSFGRYHAMLRDQSECGAATGMWPGNYKINQWGYLGDFRPDGIAQQKFECVLEKMVAENPHMGGWFLDDVGSRSWFPNLDWTKFADKQLYRDGAIQLTQTMRRVADRHGLIFIVNGTWGKGTLASNGGGYPDMARDGNALADGGYVEHHTAAELTNLGPYACNGQWAEQSPVTNGTEFMWATTDNNADRDAYINSNCYAFVATQPTANYGYVAPWGPLHPTGLPTHPTTP